MNNEDMSNLINKFSQFMNSSDNNTNTSINPEFISNMAKMMQNAKSNQSSSSNTSRRRYIF